MLFSWNVGSELYYFEVPKAKLIIIAVLRRPNIFIPMCPLQTLNNCPLCLLLWWTVMACKTVLRHRPVWGQGTCSHFFIPVIFFISIRDLNMGKNKDFIMCFMLTLSFNVYTWPVTSGRVSSLLCLSASKALFFYKL